MVISVHPVQDSGLRTQGFVNFCSTINRQTPTMPSDDAVSAIHRCSASLCAMDTCSDSQASILCGGFEDLELTTE